MAFALAFGPGVAWNKLMLTLGGRCGEQQLDVEHLRRHAPDRGFQRGVQLGGQFFLALDYNNYNSYSN